MGVEHIIKLLSNDSMHLEKPAFSPPPHNFLGATKYSLNLVV